MFYYTDLVNLSEYLYLIRMATQKISGAHCGLSGHVSYTNQQLNFYGMCDRRANRIEVQRKHGTLKSRKHRNPMAAQKTPRRADHGTFDFSIPTGRKDLKDWHRWEYPETDFGLMGKFQTQKEGYANFIGTLDDYKASIKRAEEEAIQQAEEEAIIVREQEEARLAALRASQQTSRSNDDWGLSTGRSSAREVPFALEDEKITDLKVLGKVEPTVLDQWRAKRASKFLKSYNGNPLDPPNIAKGPAHHNKNFYPSGSSHALSKDNFGETEATLHFSPKKVRGGLTIRHKRSPKDKMNDYTDVLQALDQTNAQIEMMERRVGKMKDYR